MFVDKVKIKIKAGNGGNGCVSFHREKFVQAGGPDGGDGGRGGDVVFVASDRMHTLMDFRYKRSFVAENGKDGTNGRRTGINGASVEIIVPKGTLVKDAQSGRILADMFETDVTKVLLHGGRGGYGNQHFATPTRQAPNYAKPGEQGMGLEVELELKSIADLGLVGFPNVGKSTLLSVLTSARPKIANYHFTTLQPNLGICSYNGYSFIVADIPGIVEGASHGIGLGYEFLRHIERTRMLLHVIDISGSEGRDPLEDFDTIMAELASYGKLSEKKMIVAANKTDLCATNENLERLKEKLGLLGIEVYPISAATTGGIEDLLKAVTSYLRTLPEVEPYYEEEVFVPENTEKAFEVEKTKDGFTVSGSLIDEIVRSVNFGDLDSLNYFHTCLRKNGIIDELVKAGAKDGDTVTIQEMEFEFTE
ncbi:MAG: GTPase ObgE [Clostridia bacterium]|nr:GTPase ObgE [Clostridia bacterium]